MAAGSMETELKFAAPAGRAADVAVHIKALADAPPRRLASVYYDTDKQALRRAGFALRVRREGEAYVQTLKCNDEGAISRGEWESRLPGPDPDPQILRGTPAGPILGKGVKLAPVFAVDVRRRSADVVEGESRIELSFDEGLAKAGGEESPFAELELELKAGPERGLFALARQLTGSADLTLSFTTKAARGFVLAKPPRSFAHRFAAPTLRSEMTVAEAFQRVALACLRQI